MLNYCSTAAAIALSYEELEGEALHPSRSAPASQVDCSRASMMATMSAMSGLGEGDAELVFDLIGS